MIKIWWSCRYLFLSLNFMFYLCFFLFLFLIIFHFYMIILTYSLKVFIGPLRQLVSLTGYPIIREKSGDTLRYRHQLLTVVRLVGELLHFIPEIHGCAAEVFYSFNIVCIVAWFNFIFFLKGFEGLCYSYPLSTTTGYLLPTDHMWKWHHLSLSTNHVTLSCFKGTRGYFAPIIFPLCCFYFHSTPSSFILSFSFSCSLHTPRLCPCWDLSCIVCFRWLQS